MLKNTPDVNQAQALAVAVVQQAVKDLTYASALRRTPQTRDLDTRRIRGDARDFLVRRLWQEGDVGGLWGRVLQEMGLTRGHVLASVRRARLELGVLHEA